MTDLGAKIRGRRRARAGPRWPRRSRIAIRGRSHCCANWSLRAGHARIVGITGAAGRGQEHAGGCAGARAAPAREDCSASSPWTPAAGATGGAILGDRIRMLRAPRRSGHLHPFDGHARDIGRTGRAPPPTWRALLDAAGRDYVIIETVGVGQDEVEIARLAQVTVVVLVPGMGDDVQAIKAGIMEIADIFVINKADQPGADRVERRFRVWLEPDRAHGHGGRRDRSVGGGDRLDGAGGRVGRRCAGPASACDRPAVAPSYIDKESTN